MDLFLGDLVLSQALGLGAMCQQMCEQMLRRICWIRLFVRSFKLVLVKCCDLQLRIACEHVRRFVELI